MTKVDLITGFLGAGKTTFIKKYADYLAARGERVHIIENEFGGFPIDAQTLRDEDCDVSQISGGCLCCTGRVSFQNLLLKAAAAGYDRILIEPSGIYDVNVFFSIMDSAPVNTVCQVGNVITIADSQPDQILSAEARYLMYSQLIFTGCVVLSKTQFRNHSEIAAAVDDLQAILEEHGSSRSLQQEDVCICKPWDNWTDDDFLRVAQCGYRMGEHAYEAMNHMLVFSTTMLGGKFDTMEHLQEIVRTLVNTEKYGKVYRIKGYISDVSRNWYELNCSASGCFITKSNVKRGMFLIIGQDYDEAAIRSLFLPAR